MDALRLVVEKELDINCPIANFSIRENFNLNRNRTDYTGDGNLHIDHLTGNFSKLFLNRVEIKPIRDVTLEVVKALGDISLIEAFRALGREIEQNLLSFQEIRKYLFQADRSLSHLFFVPAPPLDTRIFYPVYTFLNNTGWYINVANTLKDEKSMKMYAKDWRLVVRKK